MAGALRSRFPFHLQWKGRGTRKEYWTAVGVFTATTVVGLALAIGLMATGLSTVGLGLAVVAVLAGSVVLTAASLRRLRDRNRSMMWVLLFTAVPQQILSFAPKLGVFPGSGYLKLFLIVGAIAIGAWGIVELGLLRGTVGSNAYGDDPLQPPTADVFS